MSKFVQADRDQPFLLPPDLRNWLPEDDLAHFVLEAVVKGSAAPIQGQSSRHGFGLISPANDIGVVDLLLCERDFRLKAD